MYRPTYECPPKAPKEVIKQISKLSALSKCLDEALTELINESGGDGVEEEVDSNKSNDYESVQTDTLPTNDSDNIQIDELFKSRVIDSLAEAEADLSWRNEESLLKEDDNHDATKMDGKREELLTIKEPPSALLEGTLDHYNRLNGQWRIVAKNAILRPRVNIDYSKKNKSRYYRTSLFEQSKITCSERNLSKRSTGRKRSSIDDEFPQSEDGGIPLGDIVILAYDDIV